MDKGKMVKRFEPTMFICSEHEKVGMLGNPHGNYCRFSYLQEIAKEGLEILDNLLNEHGFEPNKKEYAFIKKLESIVEGDDG